MSSENPEETKLEGGHSEETELEDGHSEETESKTHHLADVEDGAGCTEIWEHLSRTRGASEETGRAEGDDD